MTPLYYASLKGLNGLAFAIGEAVYFTTDADPALYRVTPEMGLTLTASVSEDIAQFITRSVIEPRLLRLAGDGA